MNKKCVKIACMLLFAAALSVNGKTTRSTSTNDTKSNVEKIKQINSKRITILLKKEPKSAMIHNRLGYLYYAIGKYKNSEYHYKKAIVYNDKNIEARLGLYLLSMANKDYAKAAAYCREARSIDNFNYYGNLYLSYAYMAQYKYKKVEIVCKKMLKVYPCDMTFLRLLKLNYTYQKQSQKAQKIQTYLNILR
jgi:tetratricopeptide (TPR) repeat protein